MDRLVVVGVARRRLRLRLWRLVVGGGRRMDGVRVRMRRDGDGERKAGEHREVREGRDVRGERVQGRLRLRSQGRGQGPARARGPRAGSVTAWSSAYGIVSNVICSSAKSCS
jgi:hypothetical protein